VNVAAAHVSAVFPVRHKKGRPEPVGNHGVPNLQSKGKLIYVRSQSLYAGAMWSQRWGTMIWTTATAVPGLSLGALAVLALLLLVVGYRAGQRKPLPRWAPWVVGVAAVVFPLAAAWATPITLPYIFANGTPADATQVNADFSTVVDAINGLKKETSVVTGCEFEPFDSATRRFCSGYGVYISDGSAGGLKAPIRVPAGAVISSVDVWVEDSAGNGIELQVCISSVPNSTTGESKLNCAMTSGTPGITKLTITPPGGIAQGTEASGSRALGLIADSVLFDTEFGTWDGTGWNVNHKVHSAYVHYEVP
jgi:hypothetical protein